MKDFLRKLMVLATELSKADGFGCALVVDEMERLYDKHFSELKNELKVTEELLKDRQRVLDAIPECKIHGSCIPNAIEWIEKMKNKDCPTNTEEMGIVNIRKGADTYSEYRGRMLYAEVRDCSDKLVCSATLEFILLAYYKIKHKVTNYEEALIEYIKFNDEMIKHVSAKEKTIRASPEISSLIREFSVEIRRFDKKLTEVINKWPFEQG